MKLPYQIHPQTLIASYTAFNNHLLPTQIKQPDLSMAWLAVSEAGVTVLELASMSVLGRYALNCIGLFGGLQDDLMMLIDSADASQGVHKMIISLSKPKVGCTKFFKLIYDGLRKIKREETYRLQSTSSWLPQDDSNPRQ